MLTLLGPLLALPLALDEVTTPAAESEEATGGATHLIERGEFPVLRIPQDEELIFRVRVDATLFETTMAQVTMKSTVEEYRPPLLGARKETEGTEKRKTATLSLHAFGENMLYTMDALMESHHHERDWPAFVYRYESAGSDSRRRELTVGRREDGYRSIYRADTSHNAPRGTRIWGAPLERDVPEDSLDMLTSIYLIRTMMAEEESSMEFHMVDKHRVWEVTLKRGRRALIQTLTGEFRAVEVLMDTRRPAGEVDDKKGFKGPFGLSGTIQLWVEEVTGVPIRIQGDLPAGPFNLGVDILLQEYKGTPEAFQPIEPVAAQSEG